MEKIQQTDRDHSKRFFCTGINYKSSDLSLRESLTPSEQQRKDLCFELRESFPLEELLILSTCNRLEIYGVLSFSSISQFSFEDFIWGKLINKVNPEVKLPADFHSYLYHYVGREALSHVFKVVSSLDSLCLGETQITGQFKKAYQEAQSLGVGGPFLQRVNREALSLNRLVRNETQLGKKNQSMSHLAIQLALHIFQSLENKLFLLIGAGKMISLAYHEALKYKPRSITVLNRTKENAENLIKEGTNSFSSDFNSLEDELLTSDIVITSTAARDYLLTYEKLEKIQERRAYRPIFLIDIALPRDIDSKCSQIENVYLFDLDDIRKAVDLRKQDYKEDIKVAESLVEKKVELFETWLNDYESRDVLNHFGTYLNDLFLREEERSFSKKHLKGVSSQQRVAIRRMLQSISQKILSDTAISMKCEEVCEEERIEIKINKGCIEKRRNFA